MGFAEMLYANQMAALARAYEASLVCPDNYYFADGPGDLLDDDDRDPDEEELDEEEFNEDPDEEDAEEEQAP